MSKKIIISADSTVDLSAELVEKYGIKISPLVVTLDDKNYLDGVDISVEDLFNYTRSTGKLAKTAAQSSAYFFDYFNNLTADGSAVIHFSVSSSMSSSFNFANLAAMECENVYVIDSENLSTGIALLVLKAAELAESGMSAEDIYNEICAARCRVDSSFVIDTLEYLHKGGRCSTVAMLGANVLKLKPCIEVTGGAMAVGKKYRGKIEAAFKEYVHDRLKDIDDIELDRIFVTSTCGNSPVVNEICELVKSIADFKEVLCTQAGSTIAAHCGPGTLGILYMRKTPKA